jgi:uncharacterized protein (TIGR02594 family)
MPQLPPAYIWLNAIGLPPRMIREGLALYNVAERLGADDNPTILGWARELGGGVARDYNADAIPWCGLYAAIVAKRADKQIPDNPLWARNWSKFGVASPGAALGDVLVFSRGAVSGHVGLYIAEDSSAYHVLGGNQGDKVSIVRIARERLVAVRRPLYRVQPASVQPRRVAAGGGLSQDER